MTKLQGARLLLKFKGDCADAKVLSCPECPLEKEDCLGKMDENREDTLKKRVLLTLIHLAKEAWE